jgi:hypothetical protein
MIRDLANLRLDRWDAAAVDRWDAAVDGIETLERTEEDCDGEGRCSLLVTFTATSLFAVDKHGKFTNFTPAQVDNDLLNEWKEHGLAWEVWGKGKAIWKSGKNDRLQVVRDKIVTGRAEVPVRIILEAIVESGTETGIPWTIEELYEATKPKDPQAPAQAPAQPLPDNYLAVASGSAADERIHEEDGGNMLHLGPRRLRRDVVDEVRKDALYLHFTIKVKTNAEDIVFPVDMCIH